MWAGSDQYLSVPEMALSGGTRRGLERQDRSLGKRTALPLGSGFVGIEVTNMDAEGGQSGWESLEIIKK